MDPIEYDLRDRYAGLAMQAMLMANGAIPEEIDVKAAWMIANDMILARRNVPVATEAKAAA